MKFLCDQCKAKYQIADEKVQGKTLRMKCRKCGHIIEIRASSAHESMPATRWWSRNAQYRRPVCMEK